MNPALEYLRKREWSMGNGQCPDCCGVSQSWLGHPAYLTAEKLGHKADCQLAAALKSEGADVLYVGDATGPEYEIDWSSGFLSTRLKTNAAEPPK